MAGGDIGRIRIKKERKGGEGLLLSESDDS